PALSHLWTQAFNSRRMFGIGRERVQSARANAHLEAEGLNKIGFAIACCLARYSLEAWCGRGDSNPHGITPNGFSYQLRLSPPRNCVCGLDYTFTLACALGAARLASTPSPPGL